MSLSATYFGSSSWLIQIDDFRILIDPWFRGDLFFSPGPWLINGKLKTQFAIPKSIDLLLLTQGLPDHSHIPTLNILDRTIPVVASYSAGKVVENLGFHSITKLKPGDSKLIDNIFIQATAGASVPTIENGYIVSLENDSFYVEPHGFLDSNIKKCTVNAIITPVIDLKLPIFGSFIKGRSILPKLLKTFNPKIVFASTTGGDADFSGLLNNLISVEGTYEEVSELLIGNTRFIDPILGNKYQFEE